MNDPMMLLEIARERQTALAEDYERARRRTPRRDRPARATVVAWRLRRTQPA
jgi:hypothetical protein